MCILCAAGAAAAAAGVSQMPLAAARAASEAAAVPHIVAGFVRPVMFSIWVLPVYTYGAFIGLALLTALWVFGRDLKRADIPLDDQNCFFVFLIGFGGGSKGHLIIQQLLAGKALTWKDFDIRSGHSFMGSQIGAVICLLIYIRMHKVGVLKFLDVLLPCCLLGHTIGKAGCFFSGDGCYGPDADPAAVPWAMSFPNAMVPTQKPVHPTPIYEGAFSFLIFMAIRMSMPLPRPEHLIGRRTALLLVLYGIDRMCMEQFRRHPPVESFLGLTEYQAIALVLAVIGALLELSVEISSEKADKAEKGQAEEGKKQKSKKSKKDE